MKQLKDLKPGDVITIEYALSVAKAKIISNNPEEEKIYMKVKFLPFWIFPSYIISKYNSHNFQNYNILNRL